MEQQDHIDALSDVFFAPPDMSMGSLQMLKELGPKSDQFRQAFRSVLAACNAPIALVAVDDALAVASELQGYAVTMTPEQAGRFAAGEVIRLANTAQQRLQAVADAASPLPESAEVLS